MSEAAHNMAETAPPAPAFADGASPPIAPPSPIQRDTVPLLLDAEQDNGNQATTHYTDVLPPEQAKSPLMQHKTSSVDLPRVLYAWHVAGLAYFCVGGGPFGFEQSLETTKSPAISFWTLMLMGVLWALPQAMLIGELSSIYELGYNDWVIRGLGQIIGLAHAWARAVCNITTNLSYASLYLDYFLPLTLGSDRAASMSYGSLLPWRLMGIVPYSLFLVLGNLLGVKIAGIGSVVFTVLVLTPVFVMLGLALPSLDWSCLFDFSLPLEKLYSTSNSSDSGYYGSQHTSISFKSVALLLSTLVFNLIGWDDLGNLASRVVKPSRDLPLGLAGCLIMILATYGLPLLAVAAVFTPEEYGPNLFVNTAAALWEPLGTILSVDAVIGITGIGFVYLAASSEAQAHCSELGMLPKVINARTRNGTPVVAMVAQALIVTVLAIFIPFYIAVEMQSWLYTFSVLMISLSYVALRWRWRNLKAEEIPKTTFRVPFPFPLIVLMVAPVICGSLICLGVADIVQLSSSLAVVALSFCASLGMYAYRWREKKKTQQVEAQRLLGGVLTVDAGDIN